MPSIRRLPPNFMVAPRYTMGKATTVAYTHTATPTPGRVFVGSQFVVGCRAIPPGRREKYNAADHREKPGNPARRGHAAAHQGERDRCISDCRKAWPGGKSILLES